MRDILADLESWWSAGETVGLATVVGTWKSAPRQAGAVMMVGPDGSVVGSVSGGCVEGAVYDLATAARDGGDTLVQRFGVSDDDAFALGLTCGGVIEVLVEQVDRTTFPELGYVADCVRNGVPVAVATVIGGDEARFGRRLIVSDEGVVYGSLGSKRLDDAIRDDASGMLAHGRTGVVHYGLNGERHSDDLPIFVTSYAPRPRMIVFGAIDFAAAVARIGSFLGYRVTVCDARETFATKKRFPDADEVIVAWPHLYLADTQTDERTAICVLTHDPKFDVPLLKLALRMPLAYVGAMGSRRTNGDREQRLRELGLTDEELARLHAPIGLDIGARTPEETAVSVAAELIALRWGGSGRPLRDLTGPIHLEATRLAASTEPATGRWTDDT